MAPSPQAPLLSNPRAGRKGPGGLRTAETRPTRGMRYQTEDWGQWASVPSSHWHVTGNCTMGPGDLSSSLPSFSLGRDPPRIRKAEP